MSICCLICGQDFEDEIDFILHSHQSETCPNVIIHDVMTDEEEVPQSQEE